MAYEGASVVECNALGIRSVYAKRTGLEIGNNTYLVIKEPLSVQKAFVIPSRNRYWIISIMILYSISHCV